MKPYGKNVGPLLVEARKKKNISQKELGYILGYNCGGQYISNAERGKNNLAPKLVGRVSKILDIPAEDLSNALIRDLVACARYEINKGLHELHNSTTESNNTALPREREVRFIDHPNTGVFQ